MKEALSTGNCPSQDLLLSASRCPHPYVILKETLSQHTKLTDCTNHGKYVPPDVCNFLECTKLAKQM